VLLLALAVWACADATVSPSPSPSTVSVSPAASSVEPSTSAEGSAPASLEPATPEPSDSAPPDTSPSASPSDAGPVASCSGTPKNRDFFAAAAAAVDWPVYCAVLPNGWFVDTGSYRLSGGGWLEIAYKGPSGARIELHEGSFCHTADGCVPPGTDAGATPFGDQSGTGVQATDGRFAVVVDRGSSPSWLAIGSGLTEDAFNKLVGRLARLD
jgi:hypothetical protein